MSPHPQHDAEIPEPTAAERIGSLLTATSSVVLRAGGEQHELSTPVSVQGSRLRLRAPLDSPVTSAAAREQDGLAVVLDLTDIAPVAVRDRVRGRLTLAGRLHLAHLADDGLSVHLRLDVAHAVLSTPYGTTAITGADLAAAAPTRWPATRPDCSPTSPTTTPTRSPCSPGCSTRRCSPTAPKSVRSPSTGTVWCSVWTSRTVTATSAWSSSNRPATPTSSATGCTNCCPPPSRSRPPTGPEPTGPAPTDTRTNLPPTAPDP